MKTGASPPQSFHPRIAQHARVDHTHVSISPRGLTKLVMRQKCPEGRLVQGGRFARDSGVERMTKGGDEYSTPSVSLFVAGDSQCDRRRTGG